MKKTYLVVEGASRKGDNYAFTVEGGLRIEEVTFNVRRVLLDSVPINSGASCNVIDYSTWNSMKQNRIENPKCRMRNYLRRDKRNCLRL